MKGTTSQWEQVGVGLATQVGGHSLAPVAAR